MEKIVVKRNGKFQPFKHDKIVRTAMRAGLSRVDAEKVAKKVESTFQQRIQAKELYRRVTKTIETINKTVCCRYQLKEAVAKIDPELFEIYVQRVLNTNGYDCIWNRLVEGEAIEHQVDVLATKQDTTWMVECKHHISAHRDTGMGKVLQVWARLLDIQDGAKIKKNPYKHAEAWMVTNTKFSGHARKFAKAKNIRLSGWGTGTYALPRLIEAKRCYPLTILNLTPKELLRCNESDLVTLCDFLDEEQKAKEIFGKKYDGLLKVIGHLRSNNHS